MSSMNMAIFDPKAPENLLAAAKDPLDWGIVWCCVREGMHPENIRRLGLESMGDDGWLQWIRVKNEKPRRTLVAEPERPALRVFLSLPKPSRMTIWRRMAALCKAAGYEGGPRVLRHTFILNELRRFGNRGDALDLVAARAGCSKSTVIQYYLDLNQWEAAR